MSAVSAPGKGGCRRSYDCIRLGLWKRRTSFCRERYIAEFNRSFQVAPEQRGNAFVPRRSADLERIFSLQFERAVQRDNTVSFQNLSLQIEKVRWRGTLAGCQVVVHQHLDGTLSLTHGPHCLGRYTSEGATLATTHMPAQRAVEKTRAGKVITPTFPPPRPRLLLFN